MDNEMHHKNLLKILVDIYQDSYLAKNLYFKGGTAFYLFYDLPRFSTDLDFDISSECKDEQKIFDNLQKILVKYGQIKTSYIKRNTVFFVLSYEKFHRLLKVEASKRPSLENFEIKNIFGVDIKLLSLELLCAHKLVALTERVKARDLFDAYFILLNKFPINEQIIKARTDKSMQEFWKYLAGKIGKNFHKTNVLHELGEVVDEKKKQWIREKLKDEVLGMIEKKLNS